MGSSPTFGTQGFALRNHFVDNTGMVQETGDDYRYDYRTGREMNDFDLSDDEPEIHLASINEAKVTSKELFAAAEAVVHDTSDEVDIYTVARHVLATVRADDDEPLTNVFFGKWTDCGGPDFEICANDTVRIWVHGNWCPLPAVKTRGDFRTLCRLLGVTPI